MLRHFATASNPACHLLELMSAAEDLDSAIELPPSPCECPSAILRFSFCADESKSVKTDLFGVRATGSAPGEATAAGGRLHSTHESGTTQTCTGRRHSTLHKFAHHYSTG